MDSSWVLSALISVIGLLITILIAVLSWTFKRVLTEQDRKIETLFDKNKANEAEHKFYAQSLATQTQWMKNVDDKLDRIQNQMNGHSR